ncbi:MAG: hypothetical protein AB7V77_05145 [Candidatus Woesearchaeota archaeon]
MIDEKLVEDEIFDVLVRDYVNVAWENFKEDYDKSKKTYIGNKNKECSPLLLIVNGSDLNEKLIENKLIKKRDLSGPYCVSHKDENTFANVLDFYRGKEGAILYNSDYGLIYHAKKVQNFKLKGGVESYVEDDFTSIKRELHCSEFKEDGHIAIRAPQIHNCKSYLIRPNAYTPRGLSKISSFNEYGIAKEFFIAPKEYFPGCPLFDEERNVVAIFRFHLYGTDFKREEVALNNEQIQNGVSKSFEEERSVSFPISREKFYEVYDDKTNLIKAS